MRYRYLSLLLGPILGLSLTMSAQSRHNNSAFKQLKEELPSPNMYRTGGGQPGAFYYQQQADYSMEIELDAEKKRLYGSETITYTNNAPESLDYLWVQLDQNMRKPGSLTQQMKKGRISEKMSYRQLKSLFYDFQGGFEIDQVQDAEGQDMAHTINHTMMRIDLEEPLEQGESVSFSIDWEYLINDRQEIGGRSGYEEFSETGNSIFTIAQFFPRMAVYNDVEGWQNKQFLGRGEFALPFGNYDVKITVPEDHVLGATGKLQNAKEVLSAEERERLDQARRSTEDPVYIVSPQEARRNQKKKSSATKTWHFQAEQVRDFAFASSRKFMWDAMGVPLGTDTVMAMSYFPEEGNPLWERYSTRAVAHTLKVYSRFTFDYPYHKAISVHTDRIGMEYPMICFNGGRPEADGTYSKRTKYGLISVIIHEVGHNFFPMIVNSDERQWTWMDEGLNTFVQYLAEKEWEEGYPSRRGPAYKIVDYMRSQPEDMMPIMTNSESILQFGNNAYGKPATALNILRETIMGRELFDMAFQTYAQRWKFKHPTPADFFRSMEDASATDLDWFFRGWFYSTHHVDIALKEVNWYQLSSGDPDREKPRQREKNTVDNFLGDLRNDTALAGKRYAHKHPEVKDFYNRNDRYTVLEADRKEYEEYRSSLSEEEQALLDEGYHFYEVTFENQGGLVMPVIMEFTFEDGSKKLVRSPAQIWLKNEHQFTKTYVFEQEVRSMELDPHLETADTDRDDNYWPPQREPSRFELYQRGQRSGKNLMQKMEED